MDEAIDKAWKLGDFNPLSQAIQRGASINFQRDIKSGGKTALIDWSDLGDDEDPDSNDERFYGNDYPDDDEGDEIVKELQDEINQSDDDSNDDDKLTWRQKQYKSGNHNIGH
eukprot:gene23836-30929_t